MCVRHSNHVQVFPNAHVIHQVQDGRDYALNNRLRRSSRTTNIFERHFVSFLTGKWHLKAGVSAG
jgi:hypothetical protein